MLELFVQETEKTLADLDGAIGRKDYRKASALIHKSAPLWETIRIGIPVPELERLASLPPDAWDDAQLSAVRKLAEAVEMAVETARKVREEME